MLQDWLLLPLAARWTLDQNCAWCSYQMFGLESCSGNKKNTSMKDYRKGTVHCRCCITLLKEPGVMDEPDFNPEILSFFLKPLLLVLASFMAPVMFQQHGAQHRLTSWKHACSYRQRKLKAVLWQHYCSEVLPMARALPGKGSNDTLEQRCRHIQEDLNECMPDSFFYLNFLLQPTSYKWLHHF